MDERRIKGGGGGMYDLTAHPNEYIKAYFGGLVSHQSRGIMEAAAAVRLCSSPADGRQ